MRNSGIFSDRGIFHFDKVADFNMIQNFRIRTDVTKRADFDVIMNLGLVTLTCIKYGIVADYRILYQGIRPDHTDVSDFCVPFQNGSRQNDRVLPDGNLRHNQHAVG